jgi:hypothetical protein
VPGPAVLAQEASVFMGPGQTATAGRSPTCMPSEDVLFIITSHHLALLA